MISLSTPTYDPDGHVILYDATGDVESLDRRVTRTATLDGGVAIDDNGYAAGDRTLYLELRNYSGDLADNLKRLVRLYPLLWVSTPEGAFQAAPSSIQIKNGVLRLTLIVESQISA